VGIRTTITTLEKPEDHKPHHVGRGHEFGEDVSNTSRSIATHETSEVGQVPIPQGDSGKATVDSTTSWYVLVLLMFSYALAYVDRQLLNLVVDPIKHSLLISDTQLSLIQGVAFVIAYLLAAPVFGRLVDTGNRRNILITGICLWCVFAALCGKADTYWELFAARFGVGASEACVFPVCLSLIADLFSTRTTPRAISIFLIGQWIGAGASLLTGGLVLSLADTIRKAFPVFDGLATWQMAFVIVGLPGLLLATILFTVREPARGVSNQTSDEDRTFELREGLQFLWQRRSFYGRMFFGSSMLGIVTLALPSWLPTYLIRVHGVSASQVGYRLGFLSIILGTTGVLLGPWIVRLFERRGFPDAALRVAGFSMIGMFVFCASIPFAPGLVGVFAAAAGAIFFFTLPMAIGTAASQICTPRRLRGLVAAFYTFMSQSIGFGIGPTAIALITDKVFGNPNMVGYSLAIVASFASAVGACLMFSALPHYRRMLVERNVENR